MTTSPKHIPTDVDVVRSGESYALSCVYNGARYHVWLSRSTREIRPTLYKNPPMDTKHKGEGYFPTRHLRNDSIFAEALILSMLEQANTADLFEKAEEAVRQREEADRKAGEEYQRQQRIIAAAPELYEAATHAAPILDGIIRAKGIDWVGGASAQKWLDALKAAIAKADGVTP